MATRLADCSPAGALAVLSGTASKDGPAMARDLRRLIDMKDDAHYATRSLALSRAREAVSWARRLYDAAERIL